MYFTHISQEQNYILTLNFNINHSISNYEYIDIREEL